LIWGWSFYVLTIIVRLKSVETTPNPNSMKLNFHESLGKAITYTEENADTGSDFVRALLQIEGVKSVFVCQDFITLNRAPTVDWNLILDAARRVCGKETERTPQTPVSAQAALDGESEAAGNSGPVSVVVQTFKGIPIQVKVLGSGAEKRVALSERFLQAAQAVQDKTGADFLKDRYWADYGLRYGELDEIAAQVADEIESTTDAQTLQYLCELSTGTTKVRRFAAAGLGLSGSITAVPALCRVLLSDATVAVRRTAGDALSDIGDASAEPFVCKALADENKLVRWRACRFLTEVGSSEALPFLKAVLQDKETEVRLEAQAAIERIAKGDKGLAPVWKRMHESDT
jgi:hypothetical protein